MNVSSSTSQKTENGTFGTTSPVGSATVPA